MEVVLPRWKLYRHPERYSGGELNDRQFTRKFEALLQRQHAWLANKGVSGVRAAVAIHAGVLVLSLPGLRAEAQERGLPLESVELQAVREAAADVARNYGLDQRRVADAIAGLIARYGE
jgi:hypothetical protein